MADRGEHFEALVWLFFGLVVLELVFVVLFVPSNILIDYNAGERAHVAADLGASTENQVTNLATTWYRVTLVKPGFVEALNTFLFGGDAPIAGHDYNGYNYVRDRIRTFWNMLYAVYYRLALIFIWVPYLLPLFLATLIDAYQQRRVRQVRFSYVSPLTRSLASRMRTSIISLLVLVLVLPVHVPAMTYPFVLGLLLLTMWLTVTHLQKHI